MGLGEVPFEDKRIEFSQWKDLKPTTPYGQLPLLSVDGGPSQTQSGAMLRWASTLNPDSGLYPIDNMYEIEEAIGITGDMKRSWTPNLMLAMRPTNFGYPEGYSGTEEGKEKIKSLREKWIKEELPKYLEFLSDKIKKNGGKWLASTDKPTIADCDAIPLLRSFSRGYIDYVDPSCLEINPTIVDYIKRFCALEQIKGRYSNGIF